MPLFPAAPISSPWRLRFSPPGCRLLDEVFMGYSILGNIVALAFIMGSPFSRRVWVSFDSFQLWWMCIANCDVSTCPVDGFVPLPMHRTPGSGILI
jgi:hypothetical protein